MQSLDQIAEQNGVTRNTLEQWFKYFWFVKVPTYECHRKYVQVFVDGTYMGRSCKQCLLIACNCQGQVLTWHWCYRENTESYLQLFSRLAPPDVVTLDGHKGAEAAVARAFPNARIQRCLVHVKRDVIRCTTMHPKQAMHRILYALACKLVTIKTTDQAARWAAELQQFESTFAWQLKHRTYRSTFKDDQLPSWVRDGQVWWYTHRRSRQADSLLRRCFQRGQLFTFLETRDEVGNILSNSTNVLEGGLNAQIKELLHRHRGMSAEHVRRMIDWFLFTHCIYAKDPVKIAVQQHFGRDGYQQAQVLAEQMRADDSRFEPVEFDTGISVTEYRNDLAIRKGQI